MPSPTLFQPTTFVANPLPRLILLEDHTDPITGVLLSKLLPKLQELGYRSFFDEVEEECSLTEHIDCLHFEEKVFKTSGMSEAMFSNFDPCFAAKMTLKSFLEELSHTSMIYRGIDLEHTQEMADELSFYRPKRDKKIASHYLNAESAVFGRDGINHLLGIQKEILNHIPKEIADRQFCFVNFYTDPFYSTHAITDETQRRLQYPLDICVYDNNTISVDQAVAFILEEINKKIIANEETQLIRKSIDCIR